jgi:hypothetical protein
MSPGECPRKRCWAWLMRPPPVSLPAGLRLLLPVPRDGVVIRGAHGPLDRTAGSSGRRFWPALWRRRQVMLPRPPATDCIYGAHHTRVDVFSNGLCRSADVSHPRRADAGLVAAVVSSWLRLRSFFFVQNERAQRRKQDTSRCMPQIAAGDVVNRGGNRRHGCVLWARGACSAPEIRTAERLRHLHKRITSCRGVSWRSSLAKRGPPLLLLSRRTTTAFAPLPASAPRAGANEEKRFPCTHLI